MKVLFSPLSRSRENIKTLTPTKSIRCCLNDFMTRKKSSMEGPNMGIEKLPDTNAKIFIKHKMSFRSSTLPSRKRMKESKCNLDKNGSQSLFDLAGADPFGTNENTPRKYDSTNESSSSMKITSPSPRSLLKKEKRFLGFNLAKKRSQSADFDKIQREDIDSGPGNIYFGNYSAGRGKMTKMKSFSRKNSNAALFESRSPDLTALLCDKTLLLRFHKFLKAEHSEENLEFWLECEMYRREYPMKKNEKREKMARHMMAQFLGDSSPKQVNLPARVRNPIYLSIKNNNFYRELFDEAQMIVFLIMANDCLPRFQSSLIYKKHRGHDLQKVKRHLHLQHSKTRPLQIKKTQQNSSAENGATFTNFIIPSSLTQDKKT